MSNRIMVIDDDREFLYEMEETLRLSDYDVVTLNDSAFALDQVIHSKPDLILLDIKMPEESGFQVACKIKYFPALKNIPIIAVTGHMNDRYRKLVNGYGIQDFMMKPVDPIELISRIERYL